MRGKQGKVAPLGLEKAQWLSRDAWQSRQIYPIPVLLGFVWKTGLTQEGFVFPLHAHFGLDSLVSLTGHTSGSGAAHSFLSHSQ